MRERLRAKFIHALGNLGKHLEALGRHDEAIAWYLKGLDADAIVEPFYQGTDALLREARPTHRGNRCVSPTAADLVRHARTAPLGEHREALPVVTGGVTGRPGPA